MKIVHIFLIGILFAFNLQAQSNWYQVNSNVQDEIFDVFFQDSLTGYATAGNKILKSTDAGESWSLFYQDTSLLSFRSISTFKDSLFVIGYDTIISTASIKTSINIINQADKQSIKFNLNAINYPTAYFGLQSMGEEVWFQTDNGIYTYKNSTLTLINDEAIIFNSINGKVIGVSEGEVFLTSDSGLTWDTIPKPYFNFGLTACYYDGTDTIIVTNSGFPKSFEYSYDRGLNWVNVSINSYIPVISFFNSQQQIGVRVVSATPKGIVYSSTNVGQNFYGDTLILNKPLKGTYIFNNQLAFVFGVDGQIYKTTNAGGLVGLKKINYLKQMILRFTPILHRVL